MKPFRISCAINQMTNSIHGRVCDAIGNIYLVG